jgi:ligand-binding sensor domain-containing protein
MMKKTIILIIILFTGAVFAQNLPVEYKLSERRLAKTSDATPKSNSIIDILLVEDTVWLGTSRGLSRSIDEGANWTNFYRTKPFGEDNITAVGVYENTIWASTANSVERNGETLPNGTGIKFSTDAGNNWTEIPQPLDDPGDSSITYGINNLRALPVTTTVNNLVYDIAFTKNTIWIATFAGGLRKSNIDSLIANPARKWERVVLPPDYLNSIKPSDTLNFSLQPVAGNFGNESYLNHRLFSLTAVNDSTIYAGSANGINKSTDNGLSWTKFNHQNQNNPITGNFVVALNYDKVQDVVWAATWQAEDFNESYGVSFSGDGGNNWETALMGERAHNFGFVNYSNSTDVLAATDNGVFRSQNLGSSWVLPPKIRDNQSNITLKAEVFYSASSKKNSNGHQIWLGSTNGLVKLNESGGLWDGEWRIYLASEALGGENDTYAFPNPFAPSLEETKIKYDTGNQAKEVSIRILDFDMNLVRTLIQNASRNPGEQIEYWNGKNDNGSTVSNGVYFYRIDIGSKDPIYGKIMVLN